MAPTKASEGIYRPSGIARLLKEMFDFYKNSNQILQGVEFYQEYPQGTSPEDLKLPAITFHLERKDPSGENTFGAANKGLKEIKPRHREAVDDPNNPSYKLEFWGQRYELIVQFDVWATTNITADEVAHELEQFIHTVQGILMDRGIQNIYFRGSKIDKMVKWKDQVTHRTIEYLFLIEQVFRRSEKTIEEIRSHIEIRATLEEQ